MSGPLRLRNGLCADRADHEPHEHVSDSLGRFWCTADQSQREPLRSERLRQAVAPLPELVRGFWSAVDRW